MSATANGFKDGSVELRIPMWGYEPPFCVVLPYSVFPRYESPCGVMSLSSSDNNAASASLRIPMWGYETVLAAPKRFQQRVTNPHVGL